MAALVNGGLDLLLEITILDRGFVEENIFGAIEGVRA